jgi:hypothetical protein
MSSIMIHLNFKSSRNPNKVERKFYKVWGAMMARCSAKAGKDKKWYFDKGIKVCERWQNFEFFFIDMWDSYLLHRELNDCDTELDRVNNEKGYSKGNCKWSTRLENMNNTHNVRKLKGKTFSQWSKLLGIDSKTLIRRYEVGWSIDRILSPKLERARKIITS